VTRAFSRKNRPIVFSRYTRQYSRIVITDVAMLNANGEWYNIINIVHTKTQAPVVKFTSGVHDKIDYSSAGVRGADSHLQPGIQETHVPTKRSPGKQRGRSFNDRSDVVRVIACKKRKELMNIVMTTVKKIIIFYRSILFDSPYYMITIIYNLLRQQENILYYIVYKSI